MSTLTDELCPFWNNNPENPVRLQCKLSLRAQPTCFAVLCANEVSDLRHSGEWGRGQWEQIHGGRGHSLSEGIRSSCLFSKKRSSFWIIFGACASSRGHYCVLFCFSLPLFFPVAVLVRPCGLVRCWCGRGLTTATATAEHLFPRSSATQGPRQNEKLPEEDNERDRSWRQTFPKK